jgi:hypothetical protein
MVDLIRVSIWWVCASVSWAMSSSVASACSSTIFALYCFTVSLFCLFAFEYFVEMKVSMFAHVFWAFAWIPILSLPHQVLLSFFRSIVPCWFALLNI